MALLGYLTYQPEAAGWPFAWPQAYQWALRWPRALVALSCGGALALAGVLLQRLMYNPLASPDLLGVSSGATLTLVLAMLWCGQTLTALQQWGVGLAGSLAVLAALMALGRRQRYAPASVILTGIALTALLQALVQFFLAQGGQDSYRILQWLAGSTYRVTAVQALLLSTLTALLLLLALFVARALTLLSIGRAFSQARGLNGARATALLLALVALLCAIATAAMGPVGRTWRRCWARGRPGRRWGWPRCWGLRRCCGQTGWGRPYCTPVRWRPGRWSPSSGPPISCCC